MIDLRKLLQRDALVPEENPETQLDASSRSVDEITAEYRDIVMDQIARGGVSASSVELDVRAAGKLRDGRVNYVGMLRLVQWERPSAVRLLLGLPILESRVRRLVRGSWLNDVSHFGGLWLHASGQLQDSDAMEDLRMLLIDIEKREEQSLPSNAVWSLPTDDLGSLPDR